jgi:two-component system, chemotaxis family, protein-glutamate methylesterase/glutaminase
VLVRQHAALDVQLRTETGTLQQPLRFPPPWRIRVPTHDIIVIGGSAGALAALKTIVRSLPSAFPAAIFVVVHTPADSGSILPVVLGKSGPLPAYTAIDDAPIRLGTICVAPPDHHLLVKPERMQVARGPRENRFRPAIDPLFRTAAASYGARVIGVLLSGGQDDGVAGLAHIKRRGGVTIVQDPSDAETPSMPENAIKQVQIDHVLRAEDMAAVIAGLVRKPITEEVVTANRNRRDAAEEGTDALDSHILPGPPSPFTCPECGGSLWELREGELVRFQCHVGHAYSGESLVLAQSDGLEAALWTALRALEESSALRRRMAAHARERGMTAIADAYEDHAEESETRADSVRRILVTNDVADRSEVRVKAASVSEE